MNTTTLPLIPTKRKVFAALVTLVTLTLLICSYIVIHKITSTPASQSDLLMVTIITSAGLGMIYATFTAWRWALTHRGNCRITIIPRDQLR